MASMIPNLPTDVMDIIFKVFLVNNDSCRTYCQNRLICKGINTLPYQFKLDGSDSVDDFFKYVATRLNLFQIADPKSDEEIAFVDQCKAVFSAASKDNKTHEVWDSFHSAYNSYRIGYIEYKKPQKRLLPRIVAWFKGYKVRV
jgi:hypothetical protein